MAKQKGNKLPQDFEPDQLINNHTEARIKHFLSGQDLGTYQGLRSVSEQVSENYRGRVIVELIQNAHDAHPVDNKSEDGRIALFLDEREGEHGFLYIANGGIGFTEENFTKFCGVATSSKRINDGIGYKGLGFLSVLQVAAYPEIYSVSGVPAGQKDFDGFRFQVPDDDTLRKSLAARGFGADSKAILEEMPRLILPLPVNETPNTCKNFLNEGYATVVRLPLKCQEAYQAVHNQLKAILDVKAPVHLFLNRIAQIYVSIQSNDDPLQQSLYRKILSEESDDRVHHYEIELSEDLRSVVASISLPRKEFIDIIAEDVEAERIAKEWLEWSGTADISLAVSNGETPYAGRLYNFLPMGEDAPSPFSGHLNAPFHSSIDRTRLTPDVRFNGYLLDNAAALGLHAARMLRKKGNRSSVFSVPDLLCWKEEHRERMISEIQLGYGNLDSCDLAPVLTDSKGQLKWCNFKDVRIWDEDDKKLEYISAERVAREGKAWIILPAIGQERLSNLQDFFSSELDLIPGGNEKATWIEKLAIQLHKRRNTRQKPVVWDRFYRDVHRLFRLNASDLSGRRIMLSATGRLVSTEVVEERVQGRRKKKHSTLFFPPVKSSEERFKKQLPSTLQRRVNLLHHELGCVKNKEKNSAVREFFETQHLVRRHDSREFLRVIVAAMNDPGDIKDVDGLRWSALQVILDILDPDEVASWLANLAMPVPAQSGWIPASQAYLGGAWEKKSGSNHPGKELDELIEAAAPVSEEIAALGKAQVLPLKKWKVDNKDFDRWVRLLLACGVAQFMRPIRVGSRRAPKDYATRLFDALKKWSNLGDQSLQYWELDAVRAIDKAYYPDTRYSPEGTIWRLPGQEEYAKFTPACRVAYACQIIALLESAGHALTTFVIHRPDYSHAKYPIDCPSPLASFIRYEKWIPIDCEDGTKEFVTVSEAWIYGGDLRGRPPEFLDFPTTKVLNALDANAQAREILIEQFGLNSLDDEGSGFALVEELANAVAHGRVTHSDLGAFEKLYESAWRNAVVVTADGEEPAMPSQIIAYESGRLVVVAAESEDGDSEDGENLVSSPDKVWLDDAASPLAGHVLAETGEKLFPIRMDSTDKLGDYLVDGFPELIERVSTASVVVNIDGRKFEPDENNVPLVEVFGQWLPEFIGVAAELRASFARLRLSELLPRMRRLRLCPASELAVIIQGQKAKLPEFVNGCLLWEEADIPTIIYENYENESKYQLLARFADVLDNYLHGRSQLGSAIRVGAWGLATRCSDDEIPSADDYAAVLSQPRASVERILQLLRSDVENLVYWARPVILIKAGSERLQQFDANTNTIRTEMDFLSAIEPFEKYLDTAGLLNACKQVLSATDLIKALALDLKEYNLAATSLGRRYSVLDLSREHDHTFQQYVTTRQSHIRESLRAHFLNDFENLNDLSAYVRMRELPLSPDDTWGTSYLELPDDVMEKHIINSLAEEEIVMVDASEWLQPAYVEVIERNYSTLSKLVNEVAPLVRAWCKKKVISVPEVWMTSNGTHRIAEHVNDQGWADFRVLSEADLLQRLAPSALWPETMPASLTLSELGLSTSDLKQEEEKAKKEKDKAWKERRSITIDGHNIVEEETPGHEVAGLIAELLEDNAGLRDAKFKNASLDEMTGHVKKRKTGTGSGGRKSTRRAGLTEEKRILIGFVGELIAFEWLKFRFDEGTVTPEAWVSSYRERLYPESGDDDAGFDFKVVDNKVEWHFEVKATSGMDEQIELGVTEVADAQRCYAEGNRRYRILFITNVLEPQNAQVYMLPNPRSKAGKAYFREVAGTGATLRFSLRG